MFLPQTNYFNFGQRKLAHQRCAKILLTINITLQYNSHCVESEYSHYHLQCANFFAQIN